MKRGKYPPPGVDRPVGQLGRMPERPAARKAAEKFQSLGHNLVIKHEKLPLVLRGSLCLDALWQFASSCFLLRFPWLREEGKESDFEAENQSRCNAAFWVLNYKKIPQKHEELCNICTSKSLCKTVD